MYLYVKRSPGKVCWHIRYAGNTTSQLIDTAPTKRKAYELAYSLAKSLPGVTVKDTRRVTANA